MKAGCAGMLLLALSFLGSSAPIAASEAAPSEWPVGVTSVPGSPLGARRGLVLALKGRSAFVLGGYGPERNDNRFDPRQAVASFDLETHEWHHVPDPPFDRRVSIGAALWVHDRLVVVGSRCLGSFRGEHPCGRTRPVAAVYSASDRTWNQLTIPDALKAGITRPLMVSSKDEAVFRSFGDELAIAVNPRTGKWRGIDAPAPFPAFSLEGVTCASSRFAAVVEVAPNSPAPTLWILDKAARHWRQAAPLTADVTSPSPFGQFPACNETGVTLATYGFTKLERYDVATDSWTETVPPIPIATPFLSNGHDDVVDFWPSDPFAKNAEAGVRLNTATDRWSPIAPGPSIQFSSSAIVWAGDIAATNNTNGLEVYRPTAG